ncbi:MAG: DUF4249 family protein [Bacteroidetes bacterium]|nr:MAG: DUF4249 family protein [Bacteroidota bacterium]
MIFDKRSKPKLDTVVKSLIPFALGCALFVAACDTVSEGDAEDLIVVEAFLFAGEPVDNIRLTTTTPLNEEDAVEIPIADAQVRLIKESTVYELVSSGSDGTYQYPGGDLIVQSGDLFQLQIEYKGIEITAFTEVPSPPTGTVMSTNLVAIPSIEGNPGALREFIRNRDNALSVTWNNPENHLHFVAVRSPEDDFPDYILPEFIRDRFRGFELLTEPTTTNFFDITLFQLEIVGNYSVTVYRINQEYADLYDSREQDSRDLNEPLSNIVGGVGVFSAFNGQTTDFEIVRE